MKEEIPIETVAFIAKDDRIRAMAIEVVHTECKDFCTFHHKNRLLTEMRNEYKRMEVSTAKIDSSSSVVIFDFGVNCMDSELAGEYVGKYCWRLIDEYGRRGNSIDLHTKRKPFEDAESIKAGKKANPRVTKLFLENDTPPSLYLAYE